MLLDGKGEHVHSAPPSTAPPYRIHHGTHHGKKLIRRTWVPHLKCPESHLAWPR